MEQFCDDFTEKVGKVKGNELCFQIDDAYSSRVPSNTPKDNIFIRILKFSKKKILKILLDFFSRNCD